MSYFVVDVEADGNIIGEHSMVCFGAVMLDRDRKLETTFYGQTKPISERWEPSALEVSGFSREEHEQFDDPKEVMQQFADWLEDHNRNGRPILLSDNNGFDASWINYYFLKYLGHNPFGWSSRRIGDLFCGFFKSSHYRWKKHRITEHTHNPVDDAKGNAEAMLYLIDQGFDMKLK